MARAGLWATARPEPAVAAAAVLEPAAAPAPPSAVEPGDQHFQRLRSRIETALATGKSASVRHDEARTKLDAAEYSLSELVADLKPFGGFLYAKDAVSPAGAPITPLRPASEADSRPDTSKVAA